MKTSRLTLLASVLMVSILATACDDTKDDDDDDDDVIDLGDDDDDDDDDVVDDDDDDDDDDDYGWVGERYVDVNVYEGKDLCANLWSSWGTATNDICANCDWGYNVEYDFEGDSIGACGDGYNGWLPSYTAMRALDYYFTGYGYYDVMMLYYNDTLYTLGELYSYSDTSVEYGTYWYNYNKSFGDYLIYNWSGEATVD